MVSLESILSSCPRVIILYPLYVGVSKELETRWKLVGDVRKNPDKYNVPYVSKRKLTGLRGINNEQIVELFTKLDERHVEVMVKIYRKEPELWSLEKSGFKGHLLASLPDCPFTIQDDSIYQLCDNFYGDKS